MQTRLTTLFVAMLLLFCAGACAHRTGPLRVAAGTGQVVLASGDVEAVNLRYDSGDQHFFVVVELNDAGAGKMQRLLAEAGSGELRIFTGNRLLMSVPVMTDQIDRLLIKIKAQQSAVEILKDLSD